jgi:hypothetical protein
MSSLRLQFSDVYNEVSRFLGWGASPTGDDLTNSKALVHTGYRKFLWPIDVRTGRRHVWSFLIKNAVLNTKDGEYIYTLPSDFSKIRMRFKHDTDAGYPPLTKVTADFIRQQRSMSDTESYPTLFAIQPSAYNAEHEQLWEVWFWATPNGEYSLHYSYEIRPPELSSATDYFIGDDLASEAIMECALAAAELRWDDTIGIHSQEADRLVQQLIQADRGLEADMYGIIGGGPISTERYMPAIVEDDSGLYPTENPNR